MKIPKIIHQTWKTFDVPIELAHDFHSWKSHNPDWQFVGWDDLLLDDFVRKEYPQFEAIYNSYDHNINRVNLARYLLLKHYGGVFVDLDLECLKPIEPLLADHSLLFGREPETHAKHPAAVLFHMPRIVGTAFIAAIAGHPFWDHLLSMIPTFAAQRDPLEATGSIFLTAALASFSGKSEIAVAAPALLYPFDREQIWSGMASDFESRQLIAQQAYAIHRWLGTWRSVRPNPVSRAQPNTRQ